MYFYMKYNYLCFSFSVVHFFKGTSVSITVYLYEHYQLWMMDSKAQRVFFENTQKLCVWHTEVTNGYNFKFGTSFSVPKSQNGECWLTG